MGRISEWLSSIIRKKNQKIKWCVGTDIKKEIVSSYSPCLDSPEQQPLPARTVCDLCVSPSSLVRSQSVVEAGTLKHDEKGENENTQPLLALD